MAETIYLLCGATSIACACLLFRGYRTSRGRLLFWSSICFIGLALNNVLLFVDLVVLPSTDLQMLRSAMAVIALMVLLLGLVGEFK